MKEMMRSDWVYILAGAGGVLIAGLSGWASWLRLQTTQTLGGFLSAVAIFPMGLLLWLAVRRHPQAKRIAVMVILGGVLVGATFAFSAYAAQNRHLASFLVAVLWWGVSTSALAWTDHLLRRPPFDEQKMLGDMELASILRDRYGVETIEEVQVRFRELSPEERWVQRNLIQGDAESRFQKAQAKIRSRRYVNWELYVIQIVITVMFNFSFFWAR